MTSTMPSSMPSSILSCASSTGVADAAAVAAAATAAATDSDDNSFSGDEGDSKAAASGSKRAHDELESASQGGCKKRRKQSKPVRIAALPKSGDSEDEGKADANQVTAATETAAIPNVGGSVIVSPEHSIYHDYKDQDQFQSQKRHKDVDGVYLRQEIPIFPNIPVSAASSPLDANVGSWMSELQSKAEECLHGGKTSRPASPHIDRSLVMPGYMPLGPPPFLVTVGNGHSTPAQSVISQATHTQPTIRIFNPDAYCELCNKEFCNKYFLKTHKANKHGIYVDSPSYPMSSTPLAGSPYAVSFIATAMTTPPMMALPPKKPCLGQASQPADPADGSQNLPADGGSKASCDICQKKFTNKFFVYRHKVKVHGLVDDGADGASDEPPVAEAAVGVSGLDLDVHLSTAIKAEVADAGVGEGTDHCKPSSQNGVGVIVAAGVGPGVGSGVGSGVSTQPDRHSEHSGVESGEEQTNTPNGIGVKAQQPPLEDFSADRLRRLGVINVDAFCEICCKEYCNKYFLRTHKMKRHGILIADADAKEGRPTAGESGGAWSSQTSPLNLIVGEQGTNSSDSGGKIRTETFDGDEPECDVCGRRFQSAYLMQMHRTYLHSEDKAGVTIKLEEDSDEKKAVNSDAEKKNVSADLQKLQTMILQLNNLNMSKATTCTICNKDMEHCYFLRAHMMTEHGVLIEEHNGYVEKQQLSSGENSPSPPPPGVSPSLTYCHICKKDYFAKYFLKQHMDEFHGIPSSTPLTTTMTLVSEVKEEFDPSETTEKVPSQIFSPVTSDKRVSLTPTSSYCEICNKELCNKYFMKTHMQRMHGIEIENGAQIGGVICDICNKELCSKYFLRVHKQNTHGIVEDGSGARESNSSSNGLSLTPAPTPCESDLALKPSELGDLSNRYFTHFTEVCPFCSRRFRSSKWLKAHLMNDHGEAGISKWKELELQYHMQQTKQPINKMSVVGSSAHSSQDPNLSPTLKIPTNWVSLERTNESADQLGEMRGQKVFSSLFGSGENTGKSYECSYCSFSTPVLAFLFVHERSHTGVPSPASAAAAAAAAATATDPALPFQCPVCMQSFAQVDVLQHHIVTHQFSGLINPFYGSANASQSPNVHGEVSPEGRHLEESGKEFDGDGDIDMAPQAVVERDASCAPGSKNKFRCSRCFQRFRSRELCLAHVQSKHGAKLPEVVSDATATLQGMHKCVWCNFSSPHAVIVKKHISKEHRGVQHEIRSSDADTADREPWTEMKDEVKKQLQEAARQSQIPASYAVPQRYTPNNSRFVMQPFLVEEPKSARDARLQLVPSLVFLPVKEKLSEPLTVSFTLTPA